MGLSCFFWVAYVQCIKDSKNAVARTLDQIDVIKRLIKKYSNELEYVTTADGKFHISKIGT
ncbi:hypothetical protein NQ314_015947 [Rhamnusium bicolor]|uniref:Dipeptidase n=1 Tax=Rhamnusium bicolor TaxID=1586634 RepID=A0AAV8WXD7_9CUCU|nr:hypothetical protein NQ314_015947 [Rhamnusium bicolor]